MTTERSTVVPPSFQFFSIHLVTLEQQTNANHTSERVLEIPRLRSLSSAKACIECGSLFGLFRPKYSCINCGYVVCASCSSNRLPLPKYGYDNPVRCCDTCNRLIKMQQMNLQELLALPLKQLKEYVNAYHLPCNSAIEKEDLAAVILSSKPLSNENELCYRSSRDKHANHNLNTPGHASEENNRPPNGQRWNDKPYSFGPGGQDRRRQRTPSPSSNRRTAQVPPDPQQSVSTPTYSPATPTPSSRIPAMNTSSSSSSHSPLLTLDDIIKSNIDPAKLSVRTLRSILRANFVEQSHAVEKSDLIVSMQRLIRQRKEELHHRENPDSRAINESVLCRICCDAEQNCVFLDCGHMVTCMECGLQLVASKNECPICRESIVKLVHVFRA